MAIWLAADAQNRLFWRACTGRGSEYCVPSTGWTRHPEMATTVLAQAEPTVLQTASEHAVTCTATNAIVGFGTYLAQKPAWSLPQPVGGGFRVPLAFRLSA
jgi:hypothetical protein